MGLDTTVDIHPKRIKSVKEVDRILLKLDEFERKTGCEAVVVEVQNKHLGSSYTIDSEGEAIKGLSGPRIAEWYVEPIYQRSYFEDLRERLSGDGQKGYS